MAPYPPSGHSWPGSSETLRFLVSTCLTSCVFSLESLVDELAAGVSAPSGRARSRLDGRSGMVPVRSPGGGQRQTRGKQPLRYGRLPAPSGAAPEGRRERTPPTHVPWGPFRQERVPFFLGGEDRIPALSSGNAIAIDNAAITRHHPGMWCWSAADREEPIVKRTWQSGEPWGRLQRVRTGCRIPASGRNSTV